MGSMLFFSSRCEYLYKIRINLVLLFTIGLCLSHVISQVINEEVNHEEIKCLVCQQIIKEIQKNISKISPNKLLDVGGNRLDESSKTKTVEYRLSESYLTELMEEICEVMTDYVKAKHRVTGEIIVMPLMGEGGKMNTLMSEVDIIQDENLNKNLKLYCEEILEIHDEHIIENLQKNLQTPVNEICKNICVEKDTLFEKEEL